MKNKHNKKNKRMKIMIMKKYSGGNDGCREEMVEVEKE
jgi:hypothetical protein